MRRAVVGALAVLMAAATMNLPGAPAGADGTETLGSPSVPIAAGTGVAIGGAGLTDETSGTLEVTVPEGVTVEQVLLHWSGLHQQDTAGDGHITVEGEPVTGTLIGGPTFWYRTYEVSSYRADVTALELVEPGTTSTIDVDGMAFNVKNDGIGITVIYDDGSGDTATIDLRDGVDLAQKDFPEPRQTTVEQEFTFPASSVARQADFLLHVGDVAADRPHQVVYTVGDTETVLHNPLGDTQGREWDGVKIPVDIPAGVTTASIQLVSGDPGTEGVASSIVWVAAGIFVPPAVTCVTSQNPASADGRAFGVSANLLNDSIVLPPTPDTDVKNPDALLTVEFPPPPDTFVSDTLLRVVNDPEVTATQATDTAMAVTNELSIPEAGVSAKTVVARSTSSASGFDASSSFEGSVVQDLVIGDTYIGDVSHPQTHTVKDPSTGNVVVQVDVLEVVRSGAAAGVVQPEGATDTAAGDYRSGMAVNGLRVRTFDPLLGLLINDIVVAHAESEVSFPSAQECEPQPHVVGQAFSTKIDNVQPDLAESITGLVVLPSTGGEQSANVLILPPFGLGVGTTSTEGGLDPLQAASSAEVVDLDLGDGQIVAEAISAWTESDADSDTGGALLLKLELGGTDVCASLGLTDLCTPPPNTYFPAAPPDTLVVLNEQIPGAGGGLTVNAVHIYIIGPGNPYGLPVGAELIISSATSDAVPVP